LPLASSAFAKQPRIPLTIQNCQFIPGIAAMFWIGPRPEVLDPNVLEADSTRYSSGGFHSSNSNEGALTCYWHLDSFAIKIQDTRPFMSRKPEIGA